MKHVPRTIAFVDLENLTGIRPESVPNWAWATTYRTMADLAGLTATDLVVIGVNPALAHLAHGCAPGALLRCRRGKDGADNALIDDLAALEERLDRFDRVVVASGDHAFVPAVEHLTARDMRTEVVARPDGCSLRLRMAAHVVHWLPSRAVPNVAA